MLDVQRVPLGERPLPPVPPQRLAEVAGLYPAVIEDREEPLQVPELPREEIAGKPLDLLLPHPVGRDGRGRREDARIVREWLQNFNPFKQW
jgi:hypothetical protein